MFTFDPWNAKTILAPLRLDYARGASSRALPMLPVGFAGFAQKCFLPRPLSPTHGLLHVLTISALTVAIITVLQLPPRLSRSTEVIMELRYGICCLKNRTT